MAASGALGAQDPQAQEIRFDRIHLINGNFVDGEILRRTPEELTLKVRKGGELGIRVDLIKRIEHVRIRGIQEKPEEELPRPPRPAPAADAPDPFAAVGAVPLAGAIPDPRIAARIREPAQLFQPAPDLKERLDPLLEALDAADVEQKSVVAEQLVQAGGEGAPYLASLMETADPESFPQMVLVLLRLKDAGAVPVLLRQLESPRPQVRAQATSILAATGPAAAAAAPQILSLLKDPEGEVRLAALRALRDLSEGALLPHLPLLCADPERRVRNAAISTYLELSRKLGAEREVPAGFAAALARSEGAATVDLLDAFAGTGRSDGWAVLAPYLAAERGDVRIAAAAGLARLGGVESSAAVVARLPAEKEKRVRLELARTARKLALLPAAGPLIEWLGEPDLEIRTAALQALGAITGQSFGPDKDRWSAWWAKAKPSE